MKVFKFVLPLILARHACCDDKVPSACDFISHPDWRCGDEFECKADWPSQTGDYGDTSHGSDTGYLVLTSNGIEYSSNSSESASAVKRGSQCCRPTKACYDFTKNVEQVTKNGATYIKDVEDWKKVVCCLVDWLTPKDNCPKPDNEFPIYWEEPSKCSP